MTGPTIAAFRPDDERATDAAKLLESLGATPVIDPMLAVEPTGALPRTDAAYVILTSVTGVELASDGDWSSGDAVVCAIGSPTAEALREAGYAVEIVPDEYTSSGIVETLAAEIEGQCVEVARSDHGSDVLTDGLNEAGAYVHETVLYRLVRPADAGRSAELAAENELDAALFTSSLTVEHFLDAAEERGIFDAALDGLDDAVVGAIGDPTRRTAETLGVAVDVVPEIETFDALARAAVAVVEHEG